MHVDLSGRIVLVTGASRGIGRAVAERLAASGATVAAHHSGHDPDVRAALATALGARAHVVAADLTDARAAQRLWDDTLQALGRIDALVCNAGLFVEAPLAGGLDDWLEAWDRTMAVNLRSAAVLCRAACLHARDRRQRGEAGVAVRLVTVSSRAAFRGDDPEFLAYAASKGGLVALTKSIARGVPGVAAFGVAPGFTRTDMAAGYIAAHGENAAAAGMALDRLTEPADLAPLVALLVSGLADHATGTTVDVNGASYVR